MVTFETQFQACLPVSPAPTHILFHCLLVPQNHWAGSTPTFALPSLCHFNVTSSERSPWPRGSNSLLRPFLLLLDFAFVKTGFYYVSLAGQKLYVDQVELPEALPLSLECCCIVSVGVAKPVTLKRSELCFYPGACWATVKARGNWRVLKELMEPSVLMLGTDPYPNWVSSLPSFNPHQIPPVTRTLTLVSIY